MPEARNQFDTGYLNQKTFKILDILHLWIQSDLPFKKKKKKETVPIYSFSELKATAPLIHIIVQLSSVAQ